MADKIEPVRVDITVEDDATQSIKAIDKALDTLAEPTELEVEADTTAATADLEDVAGEIKELTGTTAKVEVAADTGAATADLERVEDATRVVDAADAKVEVTADTAGAVADLKKVEDAGRRAGDEMATKGNAIADLTGPLGDASGAASDFAGVFDGLGDIAGDVGRKLGLSEAAVGTLGGVMGGLGIAVAAGAAAWTLYQQAQKKAEEQAKHTRTALEQLSEGKYTEAAETLTDSYQSLFDRLEALGLSAGAATVFLSGQTDVLGDLDLAGQSTGEMYQTLVDRFGLGGDAAIKLARDITTARDAFTEQSGELTENTRRNREVAQALGATTDAQGEVVDPTKDAAEAARDQTEAAKAQLQAVRDITAAIEEQKDAQRAATDSQFALLDAEAEWAATLEGWPAMLKEVAEGTGSAAEKQRELDANVRDATLSVVDQADQAKKLADEQATAAGTTLDAGEAQRMWRSRMLDAAAAASGPLRQSIVDYVASVEGIPAEEVTAIIADLDEGKVDEAKVALDTAAATRDAEIDVTQTGAATAKAQIDAAAADQDTVINVKATGLEAIRQTIDAIFNRPGSKVSMTGATAATAGTRAVAAPVYVVNNISVDATRLGAAPERIGAEIAAVLTAAQRVHGRRAMPWGG